MSLPNDEEIEHFTDTSRGSPTRGRLASHSYLHGTSDGQSWDHERMIQEKYIFGEVDERHRKSWPQAAQRHFENCPICARIALGAEKVCLSNDALATIPPPGSLVLRNRQIPVGTFRDWRPTSAPADAELILDVTTNRIQAYDVFAKYIFVFQVPFDSPIELLATAHAKDAARGGCVVNLQAPSDFSAFDELIMLSSAAPLDPPAALVWLAQVADFRLDESAISALSDDYVRVTGCTVLSPCLPSEIRFRTGDGVPREARVRDLLAKARDFGGNGAYAKASARYQEALDLAVDLDDWKGTTRALLGMALAAQSAGLLLKAEETLRRLITSSEVPEQLAVHLGIRIADLYLVMGRGKLAAHWLTWCSNRHAASATRAGWWLNLKMAELEFETGQLQRCVQMLSQIDATCVPDRTRFALRCLEVEALALTGHGDIAGRLVPSAAEAEGSYERVLRLVLARVALDRLSGPADWSVHLEDLRKSATGLRAGRPHSSNEGRLLSRLICYALEDGARCAASILGEVHLFGDATWTKRSEHALGILGTPMGVMLLIRGRPDELVLNSDLSRQDVTSLASLARLEIQCGGPRRASRQLVEILSPLEVTLGEITRVRSDGILNGAPWPALPWRRPNARVYLKEERLDRACEPVVGILADFVYSFADPLGDLELARQEVAAGAGASVFHGEAATMASLRQAVEGGAGLIHIATHVLIQGGVGHLCMSDGLLSAPEIARWHCSHPVVVVVFACGSGPRSLVHGVDMSVSDGFLDAGACAVVATRWHLTDQELYRIAQHLIPRWPFIDPRRVVQEVCETLREEGAPHRLWGCLAVHT